MEMGMSALLAVRGDALTELFTAIDDDDNVTDKASAKIALLHETKYYTDLLLKIDLLASKGNYSDARQLTSDASNYFRLMPEDQIDMANMYVLLEIEAATLSSNPPQLSPAKQEMLWNMLNETSAFVSTRALSLLTLLGNDYEEPIMEDDEVERSLTTNRKYDRESFFKVFPNPAQDLVVVELRSTGNVLIELYDSQGKLAYQQTLNSQAIQHTINIGHLPASLYEMRIINSVGSTVGTTTLVKL